MIEEKKPKKKCHKFLSVALRVVQMNRDTHRTEAVVKLRMQEWYRWTEKQNYYRGPEKRKWETVSDTRGLSNRSSFPRAREVLERRYDGGYGGSQMSGFAPKFWGPQNS